MGLQATDRQDGSCSCHGLLRGNRRFRHLALTAGQLVLKVDHEIIQRQMAHSSGDKICGHYDNSQMLYESREFMIQLCDAWSMKDKAHKKAAESPNPVSIRCKHLRRFTKLSSIAIDSSYLISSNAN